jgi:tetratricopeptide (TPR) repeat protein
MNEAIRLYNARRYEEALVEFLSLDLDSSQYPELSYYLGLCYSRLGKHDEALLYLEQVVTSNLDFPRVFQSRMVLAYTYAVTGRFKLAEFELVKILEEGFESAKVYAALGFVYYSEKQIAKSITMLERALKLESGNANALNSLGYVLAESGTDLDRALECCRKAVAAAPANPAYLDSLGWVYYRRGNKVEAKRYLRMAFQAAPGNEEIARHLKTVLGAS